MTSEPNKPMTRRERVLEAICHHETDIVPYQIDLTSAAYTRLIDLVLEQVLVAVEDECRVVDVGWGLFERGWTLRGMENMLVDMIAESKFVDQLFERLCDHQMRVIDIALEYPFVLVLFGDDWGHQNGMILSQRHWRQYLKHHFARMFEKVTRSAETLHA